MPLQLPSEGELVGVPMSHGVVKLPSASEPSARRLERSESHDVDECLVH
jgi:hypothetical protein